MVVEGMSDQVLIGLGPAFRKLGWRGDVDIDKPFWTNRKGREGQYGGG